MTAWDGAVHAALQPDGKIVVAGQAPFFGSVDVLLVRFNDDGSLDPSFGGGDGIAVSDLGPREYVRDLALQADGKIVLVGTDAQELIGADDSALLIARYESDGDLDSTFDGDGIVIIHLAGAASAEEASAVTIEAGGAIVVGVHSDAPLAGFLLRYLDDGSLDPTFDGDGIVTIPGGSDVLDLVQQGDGKLVGVGHAGSSPVDVRIFRRNPDGSPDATIWGDGILHIDRDDVAGYGTGVAVEPDDDILVASHHGPAPGPSANEVRIMRLLGTAPTLSQGITGKKLVIVDGATSDKLVYLSRDPTIDKGPGADPPAISGSFDVYYTDDSGNRASYALSAASWTRDGDEVARYRNATAPIGGGVRSAKASLVGRAKVAARSLGDGPAIDLLAGGPPSAAGGFTTVLELVDIDDTITHRMCTQFATDLGSTVAFTTIAEGAGRKIVATDGVPVPCP